MRSRSSHYAGCCTPAISRTNRVRVLEPASPVQQGEQPRVLFGQGRQPQTHRLAFPPVGLGIPASHEFITIEHGANVMRWVLRKGVSAEKTQRAGIVVQK